MDSQPYICFQKMPAILKFQKMQNVNFEKIGHKVIENTTWLMVQHCCDWNVIAHKVYRVPFQYVHLITPKNLKWKKIQFQLEDNLKTRKPYKHHKNYKHLLFV